SPRSTTKTWASAPLSPPCCPTASPCWYPGPCCWHYGLASTCPWGRGRAFLLDNAMDTDNEWEEWNKTDPYFSVLTNPKFRRQVLTEEAREEFFNSGREDINKVMAICRQHLDPAFTPRRALDFGCGVGRLVVPLSRLAAQVVGLDVSQSMLAEAS